MSRLGVINPGGRFVSAPSRGATARWFVHKGELKMTWADDASDVIGHVSPLNREMFEPCEEKDDDDPWSAESLLMELYGVHAMHYHATTDFFIDGPFRVSVVGIETHGVKVRSILCAMPDGSAATHTVALYQYHDDLAELLIRDGGGYPIGTLIHANWIPRIVRVYRNGIVSRQEERGTLRDFCRFANVQMTTWLASGHVQEMYRREHRLNNANGGE